MGEGRKLTKRVVDATSATDKEVFVWDIELRGFGLRVFPSGRKTYICQYRTDGSRRQRRHTIGQHGELTPDQARDIARQVLAEVANGGDPAGRREAARAEPTFSALLDMYIRDHAEPHQGPRTVQYHKWLIEKFIRPRLGDLKVRAIGRQDVARFLVGLKDTPANIVATGEFVVNLVSEAQAEAMNITCIDAPASVDELALAGLTALPSEKVKPPRIKGAPVSFECKTLTCLTTGPNQMIVIGQVLCAHIDDRFVLDKDRCHLDTTAMGLVARMHGGGWYARTTDLFSLDRPSWANWPNKPE